MSGAAAMPAILDVERFANVRQHIDQIVIMLTGDRLQIRRAEINAMENAIKASRWASQVEGPRRRLTSAG